MALRRFLQHVDQAGYNKHIFGYFLAGLAISLTSLTVGGELGSERIADGLLLVPGLLVGAALSGRAAGYLDRDWARPAVLILCTASALVVLIRSVT